MLITSGASCPDTVLEEIIARIIQFRPGSISPAEALQHFMSGEA
ncbi:MAG: hypothetical protein ACKO7B_02755 [Flavobacteriales bacterium]